MPFFSVVPAVSVAVVSVIVFAGVLFAVRIFETIQKTYMAAVGGVETMLDSELDDLQKEKAVQRAGLQLIGQAFQAFWRIALALAAVLVPIYIADWLGWVDQGQTLSVLLRVDFIVLVSLAAVIVTWALSRVRSAPAKVGDKATSAAPLYASGDRLVHAFAFASPWVQRSLARFDDLVFKTTVRETAGRPPIFITSLARGGTTALLNAMSTLPEIATHRYADMPFVTAPMLWSRLAGDRKSIEERERAHGDGLKISLQSPEAFDEVFWMLMAPEKYKADHIELWTPKDLNTDAQLFFERQFRKITKLRRGDLTEAANMAPRYLSKNNANIARIDLLKAQFPGCQILVPLREPSAHAASLFRQHKNFVLQHAEDPFTRRYMRDIGHFEFGDLHRPLAFDLDFVRQYSTDDPNYWLAYWISCFDHLTQHVEKATFVRQADLRTSPQETMEQVLNAAGLASPQTIDWRGHFRDGEDPRHDDLFDRALLERARSIYQLF